MANSANGMSSRIEFSVVIIGAFGYFILGSITSMFAAHSSPAISENGLLFLLVYESTALALLGLYLHRRGWTLARIGLRPNLRDSGIGVVLVIVGYAAHLLAWFATAYLMPGLMQHRHSLVAHNLDIMSVVGVSLLNPVFEEVFVCGYIITALKDTRGTAFAINTSVAIRLAYHLYQGAAGVISIIPLGLIFSYWYAKKGRLWPLIVAHAILDFAGLIFFVHR